MNKDTFLGIVIGAASIVLAVWWLNRTGGGLLPPAWLTAAGGGPSIPLTTAAGGRWTATTPNPANAYSAGACNACTVSGQTPRGFASTTVAGVGQWGQ